MPGWLAAGCAKPATALALSLSELDIGFAHRYKPLSTDELRFVLAHHWQRLDLNLSVEDFTDAQAIAAIARTTNGNFRLLARLFAQIQRVLEINRLHTITAEVVDAARQTLIIGQP